MNHRKMPETLERDGQYDNQHLHLSTEASYSKFLSNYVVGTSAIQNTRYNTSQNIYVGTHKTLKNFLKRDPAGPHC